MKRMVYGKMIEHYEVLYHGVVDGFECAIVNTRGSHPCAYINVPKEVLDKYDNPKLDYDLWDANCNGGFTYADVKGPGVESDKKGFWLGWDYAHLNDYTCMVTSDGTILNPKPHAWEHMWTTEEVLGQVVDAIASLTYLG